MACAISGFEPLDILLCIDKLVDQIEKGAPKVEIAYPRGVKPEGNRKALQLMEDVFGIGEANWRGVGIVPQSGLRIREQFECKLFKKVCTPESPVGPCMVSSEGACAAYYQYGTLENSQST